VSSVRYKEDVAPLGDASEALDRLRPVSFVYRDDEQRTRQYGLIAEEVDAVYPELVTRTETGEVQAVRSHELIPLLLNALQRQQREVAELRAIVTQMRERAARNQEAALD
jgi:hypothetical protein